jgi:hypothetical protein
MEWQTILISLSGSAISGSLAAGIMNWLIEGRKVKGSRELQETQNAFSVGATSHMATVAFDKHIGFCEEYVQELTKVLYPLSQDGRTGKPLDARKLSRIRRRWALWLTRDIDNELGRFERAIPQIGGPAPVVDANGAYESNVGSINTVIAYLRGVLRTEELTELRNELVIPPPRKH